MTPDLAVQRNEAHRVSKLFPLEFGALILEANTRSKYAYFPIRGAVSLVRRLTDGQRSRWASAAGAGSAWRMTAEAERKLEATGVIGHRRQEITVLDREGLERTACECYAIVRCIYDQALKN